MDFALQMMSDAELVGTLSTRERADVLVWKDVVRRFDAATDKEAAAQSLEAEFRGAIRISRPTLFRKLKAFKAEGIVGLFPVKARRRVCVDCSIPPEFVEKCWKIVACESQRSQGTAAAYRSLFYDWLIPGKVIPGYNTDWRGIWSNEHTGAPPPQHCPYIPHRCTPKGWSERNLRRFLPSRPAIVAARIGTMAAREFLPKLPSTRVGLPFGSVFIVDDRFHDAQVKFSGNLNPQGVVELGAIELLSGHYCTYGMKPVRERADGTRELLREAYMRYLVADIVCRIGYHRDGCLIVGEHGTARLPKDVQDLLATLTNGRVEFQTGAVLNAPIAKGLLPGAARGNYRMKAALESAHGRYKNDMALLPGQKGADPAHAPEDLPAKQSYHRAMMKACIALAEQAPDLCSRIASPFPDYHSYVQACGLIYDRIADDTHHNLEGWYACGFSIDEFSLFGDGWKPMSELDRLNPQQRELILAALRSEPRSVRPRRMSRKEAFFTQQARSDLIRLPDSVVPSILGPDLGDIIQPAKDGTFQIPDKYLPSTHHTVAALCMTPKGIRQILSRNIKYLVHFNPLNAREAFISMPDGSYLGKAPVLVPGTKMDFNHDNLAILNEMERGMLKELAPVAEKRLRDRANNIENNVAILAEHMPELADSISRRAIEQKAHKGFKPVALIDDADDQDNDFTDETEPAFDAAALL